MIIIGIIGKIGSGKTYIANKITKFNFNADKEVNKIYKKNKKFYNRIKKIFPNQITKFPIDKKELQRIVNRNKNNLKKLGKMVHPIVREELKKFLKKYSKKKVIVLDIPLLLENNIKIKNIILVYVDAKTNQIINKLKGRKNFNKKTYKIMAKNQLPSAYKKKRCNFVIRNNFKKEFVNKQINELKVKLGI